MNLGGIKVLATGSMLLSKSAGEKYGNEGNLRGRQLDFPARKLVQAPDICKELERIDHVAEKYPNNRDFYQLCTVGNGKEMSLISTTKLDKEDLSIQVPFDAQEYNPTRFQSTYTCNIDAYGSSVCLNSKIKETQNSVERNWITCKTSSLHPLQSTLSYFQIKKRCAEIENEIENENKNENENSISSGFGLKNVALSILLSAAAAFKLSR
jgi:hypothetical protein